MSNREIRDAEIGKLSGRGSSPSSNRQNNTGSSLGLLGSTIGSSGNATDNGLGLGGRNVMQDDNSYYNPSYASRTSHTSDGYTWLTYRDSAGRVTLVTVEQHYVGKLGDGAVFNTSRTIAEIHFDPSTGKIDYATDGNGNRIEPAPDRSPMPECREAGGLNCPSTPLPPGVANVLPDPQSDHDAYQLRAAITREWTGQPAPSESPTGGVEHQDIPGPNRTEGVNRDCYLADCNTPGEETTAGTGPTVRGEASQAVKRLQLLDWQIQRSPH